VFFIATIQEKKYAKMFGGSTDYIVEKIKEMQTEGMTDSQIAEQFQVSRQAVVRFRQKHMIETSNKQGRQSGLDTKMFHELHSRGYSDSAIAKFLGTSQSTVTRFRSKLNIEPNRKRGGRGTGKIKEDMPVIKEAKRILSEPQIRRLIQRAVADYIKEHGDEETAWATTIIEPAEVIHPAPGNFCATAEKTNITHVNFITDLESRQDRASICGLPSVELLELAREIKDNEKMHSLIAPLVSQSGYVNSSMTVAQARSKGNDRVNLWKDLWNQYKHQSHEWAPVQKESQKRVQGGFTNNIRTSNGKRGKGGGVQNTQNSQAILGAMGY